MWPFGPVRKLHSPEGADFQRISNPHTRQMNANASLKKHHTILLVVILSLTATLLSCVYRGIQEAISWLSFGRSDILTEHMNDGQHFLGWLYYFLSGAGLVLGAVILVLWEPAAAGSGLPELISYMNGAKSDHLLHWRTMLAKGVGLILSVSSGLAIGPEGPTIHLGALIAVQLVRILWLLLHRNKTASLALGNFFNDLMVRDIVVAGAAAGIATAFRAPIGGVLFALEEVVSFLDENLIFRTYFSCIVAYYIIEVLYDGGTLNTAQFTAFNIQTDCDTGYKAVDIFFFAILGVFGGLGGSLFNYCNIKINQWRAKAINSFGYKRIIEGLVVIFITTILFALIPLAFKCTDALQLVQHVPDVENVVALSTDYEVVVGQGDLCLSKKNYDFFLSTQNTTADQLFERLELKQLQCNDGMYHELASLMHNPSHATVSILFQTGSYDIISPGAIAIYLVIYFLLAMYTIGISVPSGLVIPMLTIGASIGRLCGIGVNHLVKFPLDLPAVDPGAWAMVGAAAFWAGSGGMMVTIAVIILEMTGDFTHLPPIAVAVVVARAVGSYFDHGLYHMLIHLKNIPFLENIPEQATLNLTPVDVMRSNVVTLYEKSKVKDILHALKTSHNGFPVIESKAPHRLVGLILRSQLIGILPCSPNSTKHHMDNMIIALDGVMNEAPATTLATYPLGESYRNFRTLGLRHLVVVDKNHTVRGIITRKDLVHIHGDGSAHHQAADNDDEHLIHEENASEDDENNRASSYIDNIQGGNQTNNATATTTQETGFSDSMQEEFDPNVPDMGDAEGESEDKDAVHSSVRMQDEQQPQSQFDFNEIDEVVVSDLLRDDLYPAPEDEEEEQERTIAQRHSFFSSNFDISSSDA
eukprot:m.119880 g.119880  ORF g.119880 m.119880 type:complete len:870 (+) comp9364_c0_seq1:177-2786(+)